MASSHDILNRGPVMRPIEAAKEVMPPLEETAETWRGEHLIRSIASREDRVEGLETEPEIPARLKKTRERRAKVAELFAEGMTPNDIAATINGSYSTTKKDLRAMGLRK